MQVRVVDAQGQPLQEPYLLRLPGWTLERYLQEAPENALWEFAYGEVIVHSPVSAEHQRIVGFLHRLIAGYCEAIGWGEVLLAPTALRVLPQVVREPDLFVLPPEEAGRAHGTPIDARPALVVEVLSPSTRSLDLREKPDDYARARIPEYWAVDPEQKALLAHRLEGNAYRVEEVREGWLESGAVPRLRLRVDWLWEQPLPPASRCLAELLTSGGPR